MLRIAPAAILALLLFAASQAQAGPITRACLESDRGGTSLCGCIQTAANMTLSRGDQRLAAKFFRDPDMAQQVRMSKTARDNAFWARYRAFGATAQQYCS